jgi:hypothetical protein
MVRPLAQGDGARERVWSHGLRDDQGVAHAHVVGGEEVVVAEPTKLREPAEDRRNGPRAQRQLHVPALAQDARHVPGETAAGDVRHAVDRQLAQQR